jgi:hypothetical protein
VGWPGLRCRGVTIIQGIHIRVGRLGTRTTVMLVCHGIKHSGGSLVHLHGVVPIVQRSPQQIQQCVVLIRGLVQQLG